MEYLEKNTLERFLEEANSRVGNAAGSAVEQASLRVFCNSSSGPQMLALDYISFCNGKYVAKDKVPVIRDVAAQYAAREIMARGLSFLKARNLKDHNCSSYSAMFALKYLSEMGAVRVIYKSRQDTISTYKVIDMEKLKKIADGKFTNN